MPTMLETAQEQFQTLKPHLTPDQFARLETAHAKLMVLGKKMDDLYHINQIDNATKALMDARVAARLNQAGYGFANLEQGPAGLAELMMESFAECVRFKGGVLPDDLRAELYAASLEYSQTLFAVLAEREVKP